MEPIFEIYPASNEPILTVKNGDTTYYGTLVQLREKGLSESTLLAAHKRSKLEKLADSRWRKEVSGTVWNTYPVHTDRESQGKITAAFVMAQNGLWVDGSQWKFADGISRPVTAVQIQELTQAVIAHVQGAYEIEAVKINQIITASDFMAVDAVDLTI